MSKRAALVTNVTELAGTASAIALHQAGMAVVCHDERFVDMRARSEFENRHPGLMASAEQDPTRLAAHVVETHGRIDALFSNDVFAASPRPLEEVNLDHFRAAVEALLIRPFALCQAVVPHMKEQREGHIVLFSSAAPLMPFPHFSSYCAARSAASNLAVSLSKELGPYNVRINAVLSQFMHSEKYFPRTLFEDNPEATRYLLDHCPLKRLGEQEELAELVVFLVSGKCNFVHGQVIPFTGGWPSAAAFPAGIK